MPAFSAIASAIGVKGFAAIGAGLLALVFWLGWTHAANQRDDQIRRNGELNLKLATSNQSIDTLTATIATMNAEADARAEAYQNSQQEAAREAQGLEAKARASQGQIDRLKALSGAQGACAVPKELSDALEGL